MEGFIRELQRESSQGQEDDTKVAILKNFKPCAQCDAPKRYGEKHDGGYVMCSELMENHMVSGGYSLGISGYDGWGEA